MLIRTLLQSRAAILTAASILCFGALVACGGGHHGEVHDEAGHVEVEAEGEMMAEVDEGAPRVFFANIADGDEVVSPVALEFGIENYEIVPAQDPIVIEEGKGHHHLGVNTDCLPVGEIIEKAEPWIHFGDGSNTIDMQLPPGLATLTLQVGDGEHRTLDIEGLCHTVTVTVVEATEE